MSSQCNSNNKVKYIILNKKNKCSYTYIYTRKRGGENIANNGERDGLKIAKLDLFRPIGMTVGNP